LPLHLVFRIHSAEAVDQLFARGQEWRQEGSLPLEYLGHEASQRLDQGQQHYKKEDSLQPFVGVHDDFPAVSVALVLSSCRAMVTGMTTQAFFWRSNTGTCPCP